MGFFIIFCIKFSHCVWASPYCQALCSDNIGNQNERNLESTVFTKPILHKQLEVVKCLFSIQVQSIMLGDWLLYRVITRIIRKKNVLYLEFFLSAKFPDREELYVHTT